MIPDFLIGDFDADAANIEKILNEFFLCGVTNSGGTLHLTQYEAERPYRNKTLNAMKQFANAWHNLRCEMTMHNALPDAKNPWRDL